MKPGFVSRFFANAIIALSAGYVLFFFSERLFWSVFKPGDRVGDLAITWVAYSVIAYVFLSLVHWFHARSASAVFLCGALYGWLAEGTLVGTLYGTEPSAPFPLSLLCTGVSWHGLISVGVGWHFLRRSLEETQPWRTIAWSTGVGLFWGAWATFLWRESPPIVCSMQQFAVHAMVVTLMLMIAYGAIGRIGAERFRPRPLGLVFSALALGVFYVAQVKALGVRPLIILPALFVVVGLVLHVGRREASVASTPPQRLNLIALLMMPAVATAVYAVLLHTPQWKRVPISSLVLHWTTVPVAGVLLVAAVARCLTRRTPTTI